VATAAALAALAVLGSATPARADLPDKNSDREGWIKASMAGKQAAFCPAIEPKKLTGGADPDFVRDQVAKQWDGVAMADADLDRALFLANALCKFPGNPDLQAKLGAIWTQLTGFYGLGAADDVDIAAALDPDRKRVPSPDRAEKNLRFADVDGRMQALVARNLVVTSYGMDFMSYAELLDTAVAPSEHLKAAFVAQCVAGYDASIARWAICKADALGLDRTRFDAELAGPTVDPRDRLASKLRFVKLQQQVKAQAARLDAEADKDDGVAKALREIPAAAATAFADETKPYAAALAWANQLVDDERANNKKLLNGCEDTLRTHLGAYLTARAPRTNDELKDVFRDNVGSQLASAAAICFVRDPAAQTFWGRWSTGYAHHWGVRTQIWHALASAKLEFDTDRGADPIGLPKPVILYASGTTSSSMGTIATMKENGDGFDLTFKKETWSEPVCKAWKETNRIDGIDLDSGRLIYRSVCVKRGVEKRSSTAEPVTVPKALAAGLKVGVAAEFVSNEDGAGYPVAIYADKKREKIVGAFGLTF
jgi:hypothetical protein